MPTMDTRSHRLARQNMPVRSLEGLINVELWRVLTSHGGGAEAKEQKCHICHIQRTEIDAAEFGRITWWMREPESSAHGCSHKLAWTDWVVTDGCNSFIKRMTWLWCKNGTHLLVCRHRTANKRVKMRNVHDKWKPVDPKNESPYWRWLGTINLKCGGDDTTVECLCLKPQKISPFVN